MIFILPGAAQTTEWNAELKQEEEYTVLDYQQSLSFVILNAVN